jgi:hypothetical protein
VTDLAKSEIISAVHLRELLHYNPATGIFTRRVTRSSNARAGDIAGTLDSYGYRQIKIDRRLYLAHRLAVLYFTDVWPDCALDHVNRVKDDNRWKNLRLAANETLSSANKPLLTNNTSGFKGVIRSRGRHGKVGRKFKAQIRLKGRHTHLGCFNTASDAAYAYNIASRLFFGPFAWLNPIPDPPPAFYPPAFFRNLWLVTMEMPRSEAMRSWLRVGLKTNPSRGRCEPFGNGNVIPLMR